MELDSRHIVFYDGDCGFCNRSVAWILKRDVTKEILFASIQSEFTTSFFENNKFDTPDLSTFYFYANHELSSKSNAALKVAKHFSKLWQLLAIGVIVPRFMRDYVYDVIAKRRQRIAKGYCFIPSQEVKKRFLG